MQKHHINITKTARYFTEGVLNNETTEVWLCIHGYAQLASSFLNSLSELYAPHRYFIAPEGLSRFYAKGLGGNPAASWMTSEDRMDEIKDYTAFIDQITLLLPEHIPIYVLAFSQGVATASRWINYTKRKPALFVAYAGEIAKELIESPNEQSFGLPIIYITGLNDPLITKEKQLAMFNLMEKLKAKTITFNGKHEIHPDALMALKAIL
ncbi:MAG: serine hydrolase family protein [Bacteroidia bacterium]|jgi:predicted esterase|nr:serine hydrolase family protein [Bacteroidia bacterium]